MSERRITRRRGESIRIDGPATIRVSRRVTLIVDAAREAEVERLNAAPTAPAPEKEGARKVRRRSKTAAAPASGFDDPQATAAEEADRKSMSADDFGASDPRRPAPTDR